MSFKILYRIDIIRFEFIQLICKHFTTNLKQLVKRKFARRYYWDWWLIMSGAGTFLELNVLIHQKQCDVTSGTERLANEIV